MTNQTQQPGTIDFNEIFKGDNKKPSVIMLSGACCNATLEASDQKLREHVQSVLKELEIETEIHELTLLGVQTKKPAIAEHYPDLVANVVDIFQRNGFLGFPALIVNGEIIHYGEVPDVDVIKGKFTKAIG